MIAFAFFHFLGSVTVWFWANLNSIIQGVGVLSVFMGTANAFVKRMVIAHPMSKFWLYTAHAFGPDPENALGYVVTFLDKLSFARHRHDDNESPALVKRVTAQVSIDTPVAK